MSARHYTELEVWKLANEVRSRLTPMTERPAFRRYRWLKIQLQKASDSACANTAEGFARFYPSDFVHFLRIARGSFAEISSRMSEVAALGLASPAESEGVRALAERGCRAAAALIRYLEGPGGQRWNRGR